MIYLIHGATFISDDLVFTHVYYMLGRTWVPSINPVLDTNQPLISLSLHFCVKHTTLSLRITYYRVILKGKRWQSVKILFCLSWLEDTNCRLSIPQRLKYWVPWIFEIPDFWDSFEYQILWNNCSLVFGWIQSCENPVMVKSGSCLGVVKSNMNCELSQ